jgi:hypothetical protein
MCLGVFEEFRVFGMNMGGYVGKLDLGQIHITFNGDARIMLPVNRK